MALKSNRSILTVSFLFFILFTTLVPFDNTQALNNDPQTGDLPLLDVFVSQIKNGQAEQLRGIYIPEILTAPVLQQPSGNDGFISPVQNIVTQFSLASKFGSTGLLAHNNLAGEGFSLLEKGQKLYLIYGDGQVSAFVVTDILRYRALNPMSTSSKFVDLNNNSRLTTPELFTKIYKRPGQVIFQTCISSGEEPSWGRLFVIAEPYSQKS
jgi:hypothetical protein